MGLNEDIHCEIREQLRQASQKNAFYASLFENVDTIMAADRFFVSSRYILTETILSLLDKTDDPALNEILELITETYLVNTDTSH